MNNKVYEIVQQQILDMLEKSEKEGKIHWIKPWQGVIADVLCPKSDD